MSPAEQRRVEAVREAGLGMATLLEDLRPDLDELDTERVDNALMTWARANLELSRGGSPEPCFCEFCDAPAGTPS